MTNNPGQARTKEYLSGTLDYIKKTTRSLESRKKAKVWNYAMIALFDVTLRVLRNKLQLLSEADIISTSKFQKILTAFKESLLIQLEATVKKLEKKISRNENRTDHSLTLLCIIQALPPSGVTTLELASVRTSALALTTSPDFLTDNGLETGRHLDTFFAAFSEDATIGLDANITGDVSTSYGRQSVLEKTKVSASGKDQKGKFEILASLIGPDNAGSMQLNKLLAVKQVIALCEGKIIGLKFTATLLTASRYAKTARRRRRRPNWRFRFDHHVYHSVQLFVEN
jgi:hypothetical protein